MMFQSSHYDYGIAWGTLALINAGLAQAQGQGGLKCFIFLLLLGPVATLLLVLTFDSYKR
jgi:hypothetical protein